MFLGSSNIVFLGLSMDAYVCIKKHINLNMYFNLNPFLNTYLVSHYWNTGGMDA